MASSRTRLAAAAAFAIASVGSPQAGEAYVLTGIGCRFDPSNDDDGLGIAFDDDNFSQLRRDATEWGGALWNNVAEPTFTVGMSYGSSTRDVRVEFAFLGADGPVAVTSSWCGSSHYTQDPLFEWNLNRAQLQEKNAETAVHELGHTYGIAHNQTESCDGSIAGVMHPSSWGYHFCGWTSPTSDDTKGQVDAHNG